MGVFSFMEYENLLGSNPAAAINFTRNTGRFFFGDSLLLAQVTAGIIHPAALETLLIRAVFVAGGVDISNMAARTTFYLVHSDPPLTFDPRTQPFYT